MNKEEYLQAVKSNSLDFSTYQEIAAFTAIYPQDNWLSYLTLGLAGETGEVCEKVKKVMRGDIPLNEETAIEIFKEYSDILWYLANSCKEMQNMFPALDFSYENLHKVNVNKLATRYQNGKLRGNGDNR